MNIQARKIWDGDLPKQRIYGVVIEVVGDGRHTSFVDYDELDPLVAGMDFAMKADHSLTPLKDFRVEYATRGGLRAVTNTSLADKKGAMSGVILTEQGGAILTMAQLAEVRELLVKAKGVLDETRKTAEKTAK